MSAPLVTTHVFDEDAVCTICGFDGAEHAHWRSYTYEGQAATPEQRKGPLCTPHEPVVQPLFDDSGVDDYYGDQAANYRAYHS